MTSQIERVRLTLLLAGIAAAVVAIWLGDPDRRPWKVLYWFALGCCMVALALPFLW